MLDWSRAGSDWVLVGGRPVVRLVVRHTLTDAPRGYLESDKLGFIPSYYYLGSWPAGTISRFMSHHSLTGIRSDL